MQCGCKKKKWGKNRLGFRMIYYTISRGLSQVYLMIAVRSSMFSSRVHTLRKTGVHPKEKFPDDNETFKACQIRMSWGNWIVPIETQELSYIKAFCVSTLRGNNQDMNITEITSIVQYKKRVLMLGTGQIKKCLLSSRWILINDLPKLFLIFSVNMEIRSSAKSEKSKANVGRWKT